jgi:hypothetical protein
MGITPRRKAANHRAASSSTIATEYALFSFADLFKPQHRRANVLFDHADAYSHSLCYGGITHILKSMHQKSLAATGWQAIDFRKNRREQLLVDKALFRIRLLVSHENSVARMLKELGIAQLAPLLVDEKIARYAREVCQGLFCRPRLAAPFSMEVLAFSMHYTGIALPIVTSHFGVTFSSR